MNAVSGQLSLHVRQLAWLHAVPKAAGSKSVSTRTGEKPKSRLELAGGSAPLPEAGLDYMVAMLIEAGPTMATGMGAAPLSHGEIDAYQRNTGARLTPWEAKTLRRLSLDWLVETDRAKDPEAQAPWQRISTATRAMVQRKLDDALG